MHHIQKRISHCGSQARNWHCSGGLERLGSLAEGSL